MDRLRSGFTLIELMVSASIMAITLIYVFGSMIMSQRKADVIDQVVETQQNIRLVAEFIESDVRHTGFMVPEATAVCGIDNTTAPDLFWVTNSRAIVPDGELGSDLAPTVQGAATNIANGVQLLTVDRLILEVESPQAAYDNDGNGSLDSDFRIGGGVIVADSVNPSRGTACGTVVAIPSATQIRIDIQTAALAPVPGGGGAPRLRVVPALNYVLNGLRLTRNGYLVSENIEDLQIAYHFDANGDNLIDAGEYRGDGVGANYLANANDVSELREVRINVVMRTARQELDGPEGRFQTRENRAAVAGTDGFRRRAHTAVVRVRNVGGRYQL